MSNRISIGAAVSAAFAIAAVGLAVPVRASAADAYPLSYVVNPNIYKIVSENDDYRVIKATWPPGAKDEMHSHPVSFVSVFLTDCSRHFSFPDGKSNDAVLKKGLVVLQDPVPAHSFQNTGTADCEVLLIEKKR
jgi:hypothetical protein